MPKFGDNLFSRKTFPGHLHILLKWDNPILQKGPLLWGQTTSKAEDALALGAHEVVLSSAAEATAAQRFRFDFTVSAIHEVDPYLAALHYNGVLCAVGSPDALSPAPYLLASGRRSLASSGAGGTREITEMLDFCAEHGIVADVEIVGRNGINEALERLRNNDVGFPFVIDMSLD